jgi:uncharacterized protein DUF4267
MKKTLDISAIVLTAFLLAVLSVQAVRGLIDPQLASARFGAQVSDLAGVLFYRVYLSRTLVLTVAGAAFLLTRQWKAVAILVTVAAALPVFDMSVLLLSGVTPPTLHPLALVLLAIAAALLWRRVVWPVKA